ncbi:MAG TPA: zinc-ribbon domain-containing protein [Blastocatellia bacterium]|nr:zinc-ribbon domain-containing protein [Blastocatellia bacterium]
MADKEIQCADCGQTFTFTAGEQEFYAGRNMTPPKRCKSCRDARKAERGGGERNRGKSSERR